MKLVSLRLGPPALLVALLALVLAVGGASRATAADTNTIKSIQSVTGPNIDITLTSSRTFDVRDDVLTLKIGGSTFNLSRFPGDGSTDTVIFTLTPAEFAATSTGDAVTVYFASGSPTDGNAWNFGTLDKSILK